MEHRPDQTRPPSRALPAIDFTRGPVFLIGPAHAGKSELATEFMNLVSLNNLAAKGSLKTLVVGTADLRESGFKSRLDSLKKMRPGGWHTIEESRELASCLTRHREEYDCFVIDSLNQWIAALLFYGVGKYSIEQIENQCYQEVDEILSWISSFEKTPHQNLLLVSSEVAAGLSPQKSIERLFREVVGKLNQRVANLCTTVISVTAGIPVVIKG